MFVCTFSVSNTVFRTDANGHVTTCGYDAHYRRVSESDPLGNTIERVFDPVGNLLTETKPDGNMISNSYDGNNRLTAITYPDGTGVAYSYDNVGNRTAMTDSSGTTSYTYDSLNRLASVSKDYTLSYNYDANSNIAGITYPEGLSVSYTFNALNLPATVFDSVYTTQITYDASGNRVREDLQNGVTLTYKFDLNGRLTEVKHEKDGTAISRAAYTLDNVGNRLTMTDEQGRTTYYTYDNLYQLTRVDYHDGQSVEYTYDPAGNRRSQNGTPYLYDAANRLEQVGSVPYHYDANGNLVSVGDSVYYQYDYENRLVVYTDQNSATHYTYDGDGNRIGQSVAGSVYGRFEYIYDINRGLPHLLVEKDGAGNINNYLYAGRVLSRTGPEGQIFYHQDGLGSITLITDANGNPLNRYEYDAFGSPRSVWETVYNPFMFTGEPYDSNGLIFLRARYYDPAIGRFLSKDTYIGTLDDPLSQHLYAYVGNNPVLYVDPSGHIKICSGQQKMSLTDIILDAIDLGVKKELGLKLGVLGVSVGGSGSSKDGNLKAYISIQVIIYQGEYGVNLIDGGYAKHGLGMEAQLGPAYVNFDLIRFTESWFIHGYDIIENWVKKYE